MPHVSPPTHPDQPEAEDIPAPRRTSSWLARLPWIWLLPLVTALLSVGLFMQSIAQKGPRIMVRFETAQGLEPGVTKVKYKEVEVGEVTGVRLSEDVSHVWAEIALYKEAEKFAVEGTRFWVVRPRVAASGVSGLNTLLSGAYIGVDSSHSKAMRKKFVGLEAPPVVEGGEKGRHFILHSDSLGSVDQGSPVFYRRIQVGQVLQYALDKEGKGVAISIFVKAPYDQYVHANTRFWQAGGIDMQLDTNGFKLHTQPLAALLAGGIAFQTASIDGREVSGAPVPAGSAFHLAAHKNEALQDGGGLGVQATLYFDSNIRGLHVGAPVSFWGIPFGHVTSTRVAFDARKRALRIAVGVELYAERLNQLVQAQCRQSNKDNYARDLAVLIQQGLYAQLQVGNMFMNSLYIALDFLPRTAQPYRVKREVGIASSIRGVPQDVSTLNLEIPTRPNQNRSMQQTSAALLEKMEKIPIEEIGLKLRDTLENADQVLTRVDTQLLPQANRTLKALEGTLAQAQTHLQPDSPLQTDVHHTLTELTRAMQSLNTLTDYLARHPEALLRGQAREETTQ